MYLYNYDTFIEFSAFHMFSACGSISKFKEARGLVEYFCDFHERPQKSYRSKFLGCRLNKLKNQIVKKNFYNFTQSED